MRPKIIAGNWKLHNTLNEAVQLVNGIVNKTRCIEHTEIVVCPTYVSLFLVAERLRGSRIGLGAQNLFWQDAGAYTGEVSGPLLRDVGCTYVIIGHSERRQYFFETDESVNRRVQAALRSQLKPIVCVGELLAEREEGKTFDVILKQLRGAFHGLTADQVRDCVVAYEPVWAIGTGKNATPEQAQEVHRFIREQIREHFSAEVADRIRIQYGGSVKPENAMGLLSQSDIDGALVGGASLKAESFVEIVKAAEALS